MQPHSKGTRARVLLSSVFKPFAQEWIWLGLESSDSQYQKLRGTDTQALARELQAHGIRVHGSTIIGIEHHTPDNIDAVIDHAVAHETVFHQFMLYTPVPGTPRIRRSRPSLQS